MCFSHKHKCCWCGSIINSSLFVSWLCCQGQNLITDTDEWSPCLPGQVWCCCTCSWQTEAGKVAQALGNSLGFSSADGFPSNSIVGSSLLFSAVPQIIFFNFCRVIIPTKEMAGEIHLPTTQTFCWVGREMREQWAQGQEEDKRAISGILWQSLSGWCSAWIREWLNQKEISVPGTWNRIHCGRNLHKLLRNWAMAEDKQWLRGLCLRKKKSGNSWKYSWCCFILLFHFYTPEQIKTAIKTSFWIRVPQERLRLTNWWVT